MPRLAVIDAAAVDGRRRLVLVRRDNIEHLLMIGGPTDIVVEPNIVRASPAREQAPPRAVVPAPEPNWPEAESLDFNEPPAPEPPRAARTAFPDEPPRRPQPLRPPPERARPSDPFANMVAEQAPARPEPAMREPPRAPMPRSESPVRNEPPLARSEPPLPRSEPPMPRAEPPLSRSEPMMPRAARQAPEPVMPKAPPVRAPERAVPPAASAADQNLAEMAQRLEAALRRPGTEAKAETNDRAPSVAPEAPTRSARTSQTDAPAEADQAGAAPKAPFKNLEEEMASLLGRPKNPS